MQTKTFGASMAPTKASDKTSKKKVNHVSSLPSKTKKARYATRAASKPKPRPPHNRRTSTVASQHIYQNVNNLFEDIADRFEGAIGSSRKKVQLLLQQKELMKLINNHIHWEKRQPVEDVMTKTSVAAGRKSSEEETKFYMSISLFDKSSVSTSHRISHKNLFEQIYVARSSLSTVQKDDFSKGLFAARTIEKDQAITVYLGNIYKDISEQEQSDGKFYLYINGKYVAGGCGCGIGKNEKLHLLCGAHFGNDLNYEREINSKGGKAPTNNAILRGCVLYAKRQIMIGDEITFSYK